MNTLHTVNKNDTSEQGLIYQCINAMGENDTLLLIEDGVYCMIENTQAHRLLTEHIAAHQIFCLANDVDARGIGNHLPKNIQRINFADFVILTTTHQKMVSWF